MSTISQVAANQNNAKLSTGPRTEEGKAVSSQNGVTHGLSSPEFKVLPHENQSEFETLLLRFYEDFNPLGEHELHLVDEMAQARWRTKRVGRLEERAVLYMMGETDDSPEGKIIAYMSRKDRDPMVALKRYRTSAESTYYKAVRELQSSRRQNAKFQTAAMDKFVKEYVFGPTPAQKAAMNGFGLLNNPAQPQQAAKTTAPANSNLALRL